jgi:transposase
MSKKPIRERLIRELLEKGGMSAKQIAEHADCTVGYVYTIRSEVKREKMLAAEAAPKMLKLNEEIELINRPFPIQQPWEPNNFQVWVMAAFACFVVWFLTAVVFSFKG